MNKILIFLLVILSGAILSAQVNGQLIEENGKMILKVWGTHNQRGFAQGYYLAEPIIDIYNSYIYPTIAMNSPTVYNQLLNFYLTHFNVEPKYQQEAEGIVNGMVASGINTFLNGLQRDVMAEDILLANCIVDLHSYRREITGNEEELFGCASLSSWGISTQADTLLNGHVVISRFMDWNQVGSLIANPLLLVSFPAEEDEQPWLSFTYPGMFGALSGISASRKAAFLNMGNVHNYNNLSNLHPVLLSIRNALEADDYNLDNQDNLNDILDAVSDGRSLTGTIIHALSEDDETLVGIIETNNLNTVMRTVGVNSGLPGSHLAATNHFRLLAYPVCCTRYSNIIDSLSVDSNMSAKRQLRVLRGAAAQDNNLMTIQYTPYTGRISWATATLEEPAYNNELFAYYTDELFDQSNNLENESTTSFPKLTVFPNPLKKAGMLQIHIGSRTSSHNSLSAEDMISKVEIFNTKGQRICLGEPINKGFYFGTSDIKGKVISRGIYIVRVYSINNDVFTTKILYLP